VHYFYLDTEAIHSLYAQVQRRFAVERSTSVEKTIGGKLGITAKLKNLFVRTLVGAEFEGSGEVNGSRTWKEESKEIRRIENELGDLLTTLAHTGRPLFHSDLREAAAQLNRNDQPVYVEVRDYFNAPQFMGPDGGVSVEEDGKLFLEKGLGNDYEYGDDYYKRLSFPLVVQASLTKMPEGTFARMSHLGMRLTGYRGNRVPLSLFGIMMKTPGYFMIKPYAISL
jgi:hypothetical protein